MKIRRVVSLTGLLSFLLMLLTSVILYIVPQGRIANWADWRLWNLSKEQWGGIHINVGILFLLCLLWHIYNNRRPIGLYLKTSKQKFQLFTKEFNLSLVIVIACAVGTYFDVPPFSTILGVSADIKESASKEYGEPPYGHAELSSLQTLAKRMDLDINDALKLLEAAGYYVDSKKQTINAVAKNNAVTPQQIYLVMNPNAANNSVVAGKLLSLPSSPAPGTGNMSLIAFCHQYQLNMKVVKKSLQSLGINATAVMTIKEIAKANDTGPSDIFYEIKAIVEADSGDKVH